MEQTSNPASEGESRVIVDEENVAPRRNRRWLRLGGFTVAALAGCALVWVGVEKYRHRHHHPDHPDHRHHNVKEVVKNAEFRAWMESHDKDYDSLSEYMLRREIFMHNKLQVETHNAKKLSSTMELNKFSDLTASEFKKNHGACYMADMANKKPYKSTGTFKYSGDGSDLADSIDWREKGAVVGVKNQGQCGSCWSFSTTGALEGHWFLKSGKLTAMSEQELLECDITTDMGCSGGLMDNAFTFEEGHDICSEESYPYQCGTGTLPGSKHLQCSQQNLGKRCKANQKKCKDSNGVVVKAGELEGFSDVAVDGKAVDTTNLKAALNKGPVAVAIQADQAAFMQYSGGIVEKGTCCQQDENGGDQSCQLDHGVLLVGYGSENGKNYWTIKNSWGPEWGEDGYIRIHRANDGEDDVAGGECGILQSASFPCFKDEKGNTNCNGQVLPAVVAATTEVPVSQGGHYEEPNQNGNGEALTCSDANDAAVRIQGIKGQYCAPKCSEQGKCPPAPANTKAKAQCVLQSTAGDKWCGLTCIPGQSQCMKGSHCQRPQGAPIGLCTWGNQENLLQGLSAEFIRDVVHADTSATDTAIYE